MASVSEAPKDQIKEKANNLSSASRAFSPKVSMSMRGAKVSYNPRPTDWGGSQKTMFFDPVSYLVYPKTNASLGGNPRILQWKWCGTSVQCSMPRPGGGWAHVWNRLP